MARIRSVHPGQWTDEAFVSCSMPARLLAIGLRNIADDAGVFEWKPLTLKMQLFPADNVDIAALLEEVIATGQVQRFDANGRSFGAIRNFRRWQRPEKPQLRHPLPESLAFFVGLSATPPLPVADQSPTGSGKSIQREEGGGIKEEEESPPAPSVPPPPVGGDDALTAASAPPSRSTAVAAVAASPREPKAERLHPDWQPCAEDARFAADLGINPRSVADTFRDHWIAKPGKDGRKLNWSATWRNWCRRDAERRQTSPGSSKRGPNPIAREMVRRIDEARDNDDGLFPPRHEDYR